MKPIRPYQQKCLDDARAAIQQGAQSVLIVQPTGCGKTRTAVEACWGHVQLGGLPMFVAPRRELVSQASATLRARGLEPGHDVFVRTIQELSQPNAEIPLATMVVLDEARHYVADAWSRLRGALPDAIYLGLDATPERGDGRGLGGMFNTLIEAISVKEAIAQGFLVTCDVLRPERALGPGELAMDPVDAYEQHAKGTSAVAFCRSVKGARDLAAQFNGRGIRAEAVWGDMSEAQRDGALELYESGEVRVLCNVMLLTEGWDSPRTETCILAAQCGTAGGYLQRVGRSLRPFEDKTRALLLDLVGISHAFGEPDDERTWHLDGKAARRAVETIDMRFCPVCGSPVAPVSPMVCEECGHAGEMKKRAPRILGLPIDRFAREHGMSDEQAAKELAGLLRVAERKRYKPFWAYRIFEHKYGRKVTPSIKRLAMAG